MLLIDECMWKLGISRQAKVISAVNKEDDQLSFENILYVAKI